MVNVGDDLFMYLPIVGATMAYLAYQRNRTRETELAGAELQILKMQLHPHFLFNTLQAISTLVGKDPAVAKRTIALLGDLLRAVLDRGGEQEVPLRDELDLLDRYAQIELVRFGDRLTIDMDFESDILHYRVPSLFFQPIVEQRCAARHARGSGGRAPDGRLRLDGRGQRSGAAAGTGAPARRAGSRKHPGAPPSAATAPGIRSTCGTGRRAACS